MSTLHAVGRFLRELADVASEIVLGVLTVILAVAVVVGWLI